MGECTSVANVALPVHRVSPAVDPVDAAARAVLDLIPTPVMISQHGGVVYANASALELFGVGDVATLSEREASRSHILAKDVQQVEQRLRDIADGLIPTSAAEYRILRPDGSVRSVVWKTLPTALGGRPALLFTVADVTELVEARDALHRSEKHQRDVIANLAEGVIVVDEFGVCTDANPSAVDMLGLPDVEVLVGAHADAMPLVNDDGTRLEHASHPVWRALRDREHVRNETFSVDFRTDVRRMRVSVNPIERTVADVGAGAVITFADVTEQLAANEKIAAEEQRFRMLATISPVGIFQTDATGACTYVNDRWCEFTGRTAEETIRTGWIVSVVPEDIGRVREAWRRAVQRKKRFTTEFRIRHVNGSDTLVHSESAPIVDEAGVILGWIGTGTDLSAELALREELRDSETRFRLLAEHSPDVVVRITLDPWSIDYLSPSIVDLTGCEREAFYVDPSLLIAHIHPDDLPSVVASFTGALSGEQIECRLLHTDGGIRNVEVRSNIVVVSGGQSVVEATMRDVSRKAAEHELLDRLAHHDAVTGLLNRRAFMSALDIRLAARQDTAVLFFDLDGFKAVNDTFGHDVGDEVLVAFAQRLSALVRTTDVAARLGGDEFVVIAASDDAPTIARRLVSELAEPLLLANGSHVSIGVSVGIGVADPISPVQHAEAILRRADQAMYQAKRQGKRQVVMLSAGE